MLQPRWCLAQGVGMVQRWQRGGGARHFSPFSPSVLQPCRVAKTLGGAEGCWGGGGLAMQEESCNRMGSCNAEGNPATQEGGLQFKGMSCNAGGGLLTWGGGILKCIGGLAVFVGVLPRRGCSGNGGECPAIQGGSCCAGRGLATPRVFARRRGVLQRGGGCCIAGEGSCKAGGVLQCRGALAACKGWPCEEGSI